MSEYNTKIINVESNVALATMPQPSLTGISIFNCSMSANGSCNCNVRFNGDALAGTKCTYKIYINNVLKNNGSINGLNNTIYVDCGKVSSSNPKINIRVEATNGSTKTSSYTFTIPTESELQSIIANVTHRETNPPSITTDLVSFSGVSNRSEFRYTLDGTEPSETVGTIYKSGNIEIDNTVEKTIIKYYNYCSNINSGVQTIEINHLTEEEKPKTYKAPTIVQEGYNVKITNNQEINEDDDLSIVVIINGQNDVYNIVSINEIIEFEVYKDCIVYCKVQDNTNPNKNYSELVSLNYVRPSTPVIKLTKPILYKYVYESSETRDDGDLEITNIYGVCCVLPKDETHKYTKVYYTIDGSNPSTTSQEGVVYKELPERYKEDAEEIRLIHFVYINGDSKTHPDNFIFKCRAYYKDSHNNEYLSEIASIAFVFDKDNEYFYGYDKPKLIKPKRYNYLDIINNTNYETIKSLDSISYLLNVIDNKFKDSNIINVSSINIKRMFSGDELMIYTDQNNTGNINIHINENEYNEKVNGANNYKLPYINKGNWNFNYFRSNYPNEITDDNLVIQIPYYDISTGETITKKISYEDVMKSFNLPKGANEYLRSDVSPMLYGKYFVARFIFHNNIKFKLENIVFNLTNY